MDGFQRHGQRAFGASVAIGLLVALSAISFSAPLAMARPNAYLNSFFLDFVSAYSVAPDGSLSSVAGSPFDTEVAPYLMAVTPDSRYLYVGNNESSNVSAYSVAPNGSLSPVTGSPFHTGTWPWGVAVSPDGAHLFVVNNGSDTISSFSIAADGSLSPVSGSPFSTASGARSHGVAVAPDGEHLYIPSGAKENVVALSIAGDGSLSPVPGSPFEAGSTPREASVTPDGKYLYVSNVSSGNISAYSIASDGSLSPVSGAPFDTEGAPQDLAVTPSGKHLYVTHVGANEQVVWGYSIASDGSLSPIPGAPFATGGYRSVSVGVSPDGRHLYVSGRGLGEPDGERFLSAFSIAANGSLSLLAGFPRASGETAWGAITPDQSPAAAFSTAPAPAGDASSLDASASSDPDGSVGTYEWDFGDGQNLVTSSATADHTYFVPGEYTVTLTATDNEGCSTMKVFTGQTVSCNGSPVAEVSHQITVPPGVPLGVSLIGSGSGWVNSNPAGIICPETCSYAYEPDTQVTLTASPAPGSTFTGWLGGGCTGTGACEVILKDGTDVSAEFRKVPPPPPETPSNTLTIDLVGDGTRRSARLQIRHVRLTRVRSECAAALVFIPRPLSSCFKRQIVVGGTIARPAHGAVQVKVTTALHRHRAISSQWARIHRGRWRARLAPLGIGQEPSGPIYVTSRFDGSPGVRSAHAGRWVRIVTP